MQTPVNTMYVVASDGDAGGKSAAETMDCFDLKNTSGSLCVPQTLIASAVFIPSFTLCFMRFGLEQTCVSVCDADCDTQSGVYKNEWLQQATSFSRLVGSCCTASSQ